MTNERCSLGNERTGPHGGAWSRNPRMGKNIHLRCIRGPEVRVCSHFQLCWEFFENCSMQNFYVTLLLTFRCMGSCDYFSFVSFFYYEKVYRSRRNTWCNQKDDWPVRRNWSKSWNEFLSCRVYFLRKSSSNDLRKLVRIVAGLTIKQIFII